MDLDFTATKGIEYLLALFYLGLLIPFWRVFIQGGRTRQPAPARARSSGRGWFQVPENHWFHRGHTWATPSASNRLRIGMDDFAHRLLGPPTSLELPEPGDELIAGEEGWRVAVDGQAVGLVSPVSGEVDRVNTRLLESPGEATADPYGSGWLFEVRVPSSEGSLRNLLPTSLARLWTEAASEDLSNLMAPELGSVLADGGVPVHGLARAIAGDGWKDLAERLLLNVDDRAVAAARSTPSGSPEHGAADE